jgi:putative hydrolase of HD superfamily
MDLVDMCLQALVYERQGRYDEDGEFDSNYDRLDEFFATAEPRLSTEIGRDLYDLIRARYDALGDDADDESP